MSAEIPPGRGGPPSLASEHPSYYALDRARLGLTVPASAHAHVSACPECAGHAASSSPARPPWLAAIPGQPARSRRQIRWPALAALGMAAVLVVVVARSYEGDGVREKGGPAVSVFVKRGEEVFTWDEGRPVQPQDRLRLRISGGGYPHLSVASLPPEGPPRVLYDGTVGALPLLLPLSFRVDEDGRQERLSIILGRRPVPASLHQRTSTDPAENWREVITFDKESNLPRSVP